MSAVETVMQDKSQVKIPAGARQRWQQEQRRKNILRFSLLAIVLVAPLAALAAYFWQNAPAEQTPLEFAGKTITVRKGGSFQAALNQAKAGDTIVLEAGASFVGAFELLNKPGEEFITIQSSRLAELPPENMRVSPEHAALMPKIISPGKGEPAIKTAPGAHHYRFVGVEFTTPATDYIYNLIYLGNDEAKPEEMPRHFEFDRVYAHSPGLNKARRGFAINNIDTTIKNSHVSGFAGAGDETQAIGGWYGPGPYKIINNYLEGGGQNILIGGGDPGIKNLVPSDIEIRGNFMTKPIEWRHKATMKVTLEIKNARRVQIVGNVMENCWDCGIFGLTVRNQNGTAPWSTIEDIEVRDNIMRRGSSAINILGVDDLNKSQRVKRVRIVNNFVDDIDSAKWGDNSGGGYFLQITDPEDVEVSHNTVFHNGNVITAHGASQAQKFVFRNNIFSYNDYGLWGEKGGGAGILAAHFPGGAIAGNVFVNGRGIPQNDMQLPARNFLAMTYKDVGFADFRNKNFSLAPGSRYRGKGEGGKDIGCNFTTLNQAIAIAESGKMPATTAR